jgi:hypothetical protein
MNVSIAGKLPGGADFDAQPGQVVDVEKRLAKKWVEVGHATRVSESTPLTAPGSDLSAEEALRRRCCCCDERRGQLVFDNEAYCERCYRAVLGYP